MDERPIQSSKANRAESSANLAAPNALRKIERENKKRTVLEIVAEKQAAMGVSIYEVADQILLNSELIRVFMMELVEEGLLYVSSETGRGGKRFFKVTDKGLNTIGKTLANEPPKKSTLAQQLGITCKNNEE